MKNEELKIKEEAQRASVQWWILTDAWWIEEETQRVSMKKWKTNKGTIKK